MLRVASIALFKQAALSMPSFSLWNIITNVLYLSCILIYFLVAISWQYALRIFPLSVAYSFQGIVFVGLLLVGHYLYGESISIFNMMGSVLIIIGVIKVTQIPGA